jgi:hypothetical protein
MMIRKNVPEDLEKGMELLQKNRGLGSVCVLFTRCLLPQEREFSFLDDRENKK